MSDPVTTSLAADVTVTNATGASLAVTDLPGIKAGWKTSEFWVTLVALCAAGYLMLKGRDDLGAVLVSVATGGYHLSRGIVKAKAG